MRLLVPLALLLVVSACDRSNRSPGVALTAIPPPSLSTAQPPAAPASPANTEVAANAGPGKTAATARRPASTGAATARGRNADDSRWVDVDENDPALSEFRAGQEQRDRELLQRDAAEAARGSGSPAPQASNPAPYLDDRPPYGDGLPPEEMPPDERYPPDDRYPPEADPLPDDEYYGDDEFPPPEDDYDPRYDDPYQR